MTDLIILGNMLVNFHSQLVEGYSKLAKWDTKAMSLVSLSII